MSKICRICREIVQSKTAKQIFETDQNALLFEIELLTSEWLNYVQGWPSYICERCEDDLSVAAGFRKRCIQTQQQLRLESVIANAEPDNLDPLKIVEKSDMQSDRESMEIESIESASNDSESLLNEQELLQDQLESSEDEECLKEVLSSRKTKKPISTQNRRPRIKWNLLSEEEAKELLRERQLGDYVCDQCGKYFTSSSNFKVHLLRHTGVKSFECSTCKKRFKTQQELKTHDVTHTGIKRYICRFCDMAFKDCKSRIKHERNIHTFIRPFKCKHCEKTFVDGSQLGKHASVHSNVRNYHCELCNESFKKSFTLRQHKRSKKHKSREENKNDDQS